MTTRITVRLPDELVAMARRAVAEGRARSVSAYVATAIAQAPEPASADTEGAGPPTADRQADAELLELLEEMKAEHGEPTAEEYAWARRAIGVE